MTAITGDTCSASPRTNAAYSLTSATTVSSTGSVTRRRTRATAIHLRMCMTDGEVLCCDSSKNKHASRHAREHAPLHQIIRSVEPGEDWLWCYADQTLVAPSSPGV